MHFGPDGYLYISVGDGGFDGDAEGRSQDIEPVHGKILRIDVSGPAGYTSPPTNPYYGETPGRDEIWAMGLRNPWRFSFDRVTGDVFIADVGQAFREELNVTPSTTPAVNYGWPRMEGTLCFNPPSNCNPGNLTLPALEYLHDDGNCAITGGYRYRGSAAALYGRYFYGDFCSGRIWSALPGTAAWTVTEMLDSSLNITSFGEDEDGEITSRTITAGYTLSPRSTPTATECSIWSTTA